MEVGGHSPSRLKPRRSHHKNMIALATSVLFPEKARAWPDAVAVMTATDGGERGKALGNDCRRRRVFPEIVSDNEQRRGNEDEGRKTQSNSTLVQQNRHGLQSHEERRSKVSSGLVSVSGGCTTRDASAKCVFAETLSVFFRNFLSSRLSLLFNCCRRLPFASLSLNSSFVFVGGSSERSNQ